MDIPSLKASEEVSDPFSNVLDYLTYRLIKKSAKYDDDIANELLRMTKKTFVQMKDQTLSGKHAMSIIAFPSDLKSSRDA